MATEEKNQKSTELKFKKLSVLLPIRSNGNIDVIGRLKWREGVAVQNPNVEFIAVDDGSLEPRGIRATCEEIGLKYIRLETQDAPFSLARARNAGIRAASGEYVYFEDLDFLHRSDFYSRVLELLEGGLFDNMPFNFLSVPTLFLTEEASHHLMSADDFDTVFNTYTSQLAFTDPDRLNPLCDSYAPVGSNMILRRETCFHVGLFDEYFNSWGGEDREFVFRLLHHNSKILRPLDMHVTKSWTLHRTSAFEGWRSLYRLHGEALADVGLYAMHIHHPENPWKDKFSREQNFRYCNDKIAAIGSSGRVHIQPEPTSQAGLNIFLGRNIIFNNDEVINTLGNVEIVPMDETADPAAFAHALVERSPKCVFFQNPYGKPWMKQVWDALKARDVRCICAERGAFPGSIYFDDDFCAESKSYDWEHWKNSPPIDTYAFISGLRVANNTLEPQGRGNIDRIRTLLHPQEKRNVLVLLQSLTDATTLHFCGDLPDYHSFLDSIRKLDGDPAINLIVKNHPLNKVNPLEGVGMDVSDLNIYDLFSLADSCITLNSGAGLLALGAGVPVIAMGQCFYAQEGLAISCSDVQEVKELISSNLFADRAQVGRFYSYLLREFYSFGDWIYGSRSQSASTNMSLMSRLIYHSLKIKGFEIKPLRPRMTFADLIMVPYQLHIFQNKAAFKSEGRSSDAGKMLNSVVDLADAREIAAPVTTNFSDRLEQASLLFYQGFLLQSAQTFEELFTIAPKPNLLRAAAEAYVWAGKREKAVALYEAALELSPGHRRIIDRLQELVDLEVAHPQYSENAYRIARPRKVFK